MLTVFGQPSTAFLQLPVAHSFLLRYSQDCSWHEHTWDLVWKQRERKADCYCYWSAVLTQHLKTSQDGQARQDATIHTQVYTSLLPGNIWWLLFGCLDQPDFCQCCSEPESTGDNLAISTDFFVQSWTPTASSNWRQKGKELKSLVKDYRLMWEAVGTRSQGGDKQTQL